jgi:hypothetical protein
MNGAASFYMAASAEMLWPVLGRIEEPAALVQPPSLNCATVARSPDRWRLECVPPFGAGIAGVLATPLFCWVFWRKPKRFLLAAILSGIAYALAVAFLGSGIGFFLLYLFPGAPRVPWWYLAEGVMLTTFIVGAPAAVLALPHVVVGGSLVGLVNIGILRELE